MRTSWLVLQTPTGTSPAALTARAAPAKLARPAGRPWGDPSCKRKYQRKRTSFHVSASHTNLHSFNSVKVVNMSVDICPLQCHDAVARSVVPKISYYSCSSSGLCCPFQERARTRGVVLLMLNANYCLNRLFKLVTTSIRFTSRQICKQDTSAFRPPTQLRSLRRALCLW